MNYGKESIALDLKNEEDLKVLDKLLETADVVVQNFRTGVMKRLGYDWETMHARFPHIIMCSISGFGTDGPYGNRPSMDPIAQAMSGLDSITGTDYIYLSLLLYPKRGEFDFFSKSFSNDLSLFSFVYVCSERLGGHPPCGYGGECGRCVQVQMRG